MYPISINLSGVVFVMVSFRVSLKFFTALLFSDLLLGCRKDSCRLALCIDELIVEVLIIFQEFADGKRFVGEVNAEFVAVCGQGINVFHHCEAFHRTSSKFVILLGKFFVLIFKFCDSVFKGGNLTKVCLDRFFDFSLELCCSSI